MNEFREGAFVTVGRPVTAEKVRLDGLRLECLKLATNGDQLMGTDDAIQVAQVLFDYVTEAPESPTLFVIKRNGTPEGVEIDPDKTHVNVWGEWVHWGYEQSAYRFRSAEEASDALNRYGRMLFGGSLVWPASIVPLPDGTEPF